MLNVQIGTRFKITNVAPRHFPTEAHVQVMIGEVKSIDDRGNYVYDVIEHVSESGRPEEGAYNFPTNGCVSRRGLTWLLSREEWEIIDPNNTNQKDQT